MPSLRHIKNFRDDGILCDFVDLLEAFYELARSQDIHMQAYSALAVKRYLSYPREQQLSILSRFRDYFEICKTVAAAGGNLKSDSQMLWATCQKWRYRMSDDILGYLEKDDIVEVYDANFIQIFRNFNFFKISSYTIADILVYDWSELYLRQELVIKQITAILNRLFEGQYTQSVRSTVRDHDLLEIFSNNHHAMKMSQGWYSPLWDRDTNQVAAFITTCKITMLGRKTSDEIQDQLTLMRSQDSDSPTMQHLKEI